MLGGDSVVGGGERGPLPPTERYSRADSPKEVSITRLPVQSCWSVLFPSFGTPVRGPARSRNRRRFGPSQTGRSCWSRPGRKWGSGPGLRSAHQPWPHRRAGRRERDLAGSRARARFRQARAVDTSCAASSGNTGGHLPQVLENLSRMPSSPRKVRHGQPGAAHRTQEQRWTAILHDVKSMPSAATTATAPPKASGTVPILRRSWQRRRNLLGRCWAGK